MNSEREKELRRQASEMAITLAFVWAFGCICGAAWQYVRVNYKAHRDVIGGVTSAGFTWHYDPSGNGGAVFEPKGVKP